MRAKHIHVEAIKKELGNLQGCVIVAQDIAFKIGLSALRTGKIISSRFQGTHVDHVGYEKIGHNTLGRKQYKVRLL